MEIQVYLVQEPINPPSFQPTSDTGAHVEFSGIVRGQEKATPIPGLRYGSYEKMAITEIERLLHTHSRNHPCHSALVIHRLGWIPVGETAIFVRIISKHRAEAFALLSTFMDQLKLDVPIWKLDTR